MIMRSFTQFSLTLLAFGLAAACVPKASTTLKQGADATKACGPVGMIDDCEDGNNQVMINDGRSGYWYTFVDDSGSTIEPQAGKKGGTFSMTQGGANGSKFAARMSGKVGAGGLLFAGMGFNFVDPKDAYDASKYGGVSFYGKRAGGEGKLRLKIPDQNTDPQGGMCKECFNDFGAALELTDQWVRYDLPFAQASQDQGWGRPRPSAIVPSKIYGMQWQVNVPGASYDIWLDDITFIGCP
jgi:endoglucanase